MGNYGNTFHDYKKVQSEHNQRIVIKNNCRISREKYGIELNILKLRKKLNKQNIGIYENLKKKNE